MDGAKGGSSTSLEKDFLSKVDCHERTAMMNLTEQEENMIFVG